MDKGLDTAPAAKLPVNGADRATAPAAKQAVNTAARATAPAAAATSVPGAGAMLLAREAEQLQPQVQHVALEHVTDGCGGASAP